MDKLTRIDSKDVSRRCTLDGIEITELVCDGGSVKSITLKDKKGKLLKMSYDSYNVALYALKEPKYDEKWVLKGKFMGLVVSEVFDYESDAKKRKSELDDDDKLVIAKELVEVENE